VAPFGCGGKFDDIFVANFLSKRILKIGHYLAKM